MVFEFVIDATDLVTQMQFSASQNVRIKKQRARGRLITPAIYFILGLLALFKSAFVFCLLFFAGALGWYFLYPLWDRRYYTRHYQTVVRENYQDGLNKISTIQLDSEFIIAKFENNESKIVIQEFSEINEISSHIFVKFKSGGRLILPKQKIQNISLVKDELIKIAANLNIQYNIDYAWMWK